jgi:hypothetical protein
MELDTSGLKEKLTAVFVFWLFLSFIAIPIGFVVSRLVRRTLPMVRILVAVILAGYIVGAVILFVLIRRLFPDSVLGLYSAMTVSVVVSGGIIFAAAYIIRRILIERAPKLSADQAFVIFGEDARDKPKSARRHKRR